MRWEDSFQQGLPHVCAEVISARSHLLAVRPNSSSPLLIEQLKRPKTRRVSAQYYARNGAIGTGRAIASLHCAPSVCDESQVHLAAPLVGRVRQTARRSHGGQASRLNDADKLFVREANDSVPAGWSNSIVLGDEHSEKVLRPIGGRHLMQAGVGVFPATCDEMLDALVIVG